MTAKEEILALMEQIPDGLTVDETIARLQSAHAEKGDAERLVKSKSTTFEETTSIPAPPPLDAPAVKAEIIAIMGRLPDDLTAAEAVCKAADSLRTFYLTERDFEDIRQGRVPPFEEQDFTPVFRDEVPEIGTISGEEFERMTIKGKFVHTMERLPDDLTLGQAVVEALERMLLMYKLESSFEQFRRGEFYTMEEVRQQMQQWRES